MLLVHYVYVGVPFGNVDDSSACTASTLEVD